MSAASVVYSKWILGIFSTCSLWCSLYSLISSFIRFTKLSGLLQSQFSRDYGVKMIKKSILLESRSTSLSRFPISCLARLQKPLRRQASPITKTWLRHYDWDLDNHVFKMNTPALPYQWYHLHLGSQIKTSCILRNRSWQMKVPFVILIRDII